MIKSQHRPRLGLEALEARWVPANIQYSNSNLLITAVTGTTLTVTEAATGNAFAVTDGAGITTSYAVNGNLTIFAGPNSPNTAINVNLNAGTGLIGFLSITTGNQPTTVTVDGENGAAGLLAGNSVIHLGTGGGSVNLGVTNGLNDRGITSVVSTSTTGNTVVVGSKTVPSTLSGANLTFTNFSNLTIGQGVADVIPANITINDGTDGKPNVITLNKAEVVRGNFNVIGGTGNTTVAINGSAINGFLNVNLKGPTDALTFGSGNATTVANLNYTSQNGNTSFTASAANGTALLVQNNAQLNWGNGVNSFGSTSNLTVNNNFYLSNGNGGLDIATNPFQGTVLGTLTVNTGNGNNAITLNNSAAEAAGGSGVSAFNYARNNGGNSITINDNVATHTVTLNVNFGNSGANLFTIAAGTTAQLTGTISWANQTFASAGNGLVLNGYVFTQPINLINVPA